MEGNNIPLRIPWWAGIFILAFAIVLDGLQFIFNLLSGVPGLMVLPWFMSCVAFIALFIVFKLCGVNYLDRNAHTKLFVMLASVVIEFIPFINAIPALTLGALSVIVITRAEDGKNFLL